MTCLMVSIGHGDPAMTPVYNDEKSNESKFGLFSMSINMVGTPYRDVHLQQKEGITIKFAQILLSMSLKPSNC